jgi:hypothetical protein
VADEIDLEDTLKEAATGPSSSSGDQGSYAQQPLKDLADIADREAAKTAAKSGRVGVQFLKFKPRGTV